VKKGVEKKIVKRIERGKKDVNRLNGKERKGYEKRRAEKD